MSDAILFSGGLDSTCAAMLSTQDTTLIRIPVGSRYDKVEAWSAKSIARMIRRPLINASGYLNLADLEQKDGLIPGRNALLCLIAANFADKFELVSVEGDGTHARDKDVVFARRMNDLLRRLFSDSHEVCIPYRHTSKITLARMAHHADPVLFKSVSSMIYSCYKGGYRPCGVCKACIRHVGAMLAVTGTTGREDYLVNPATLPYERLEEVYAGRGAEEQEALSAYRTYRATL